MLDVFLRTHDRGNVIQGPQRCVSESKSELSRKCISSLLISLQASPEPWTMTVIDDHSSSDFLTWLVSRTQHLPVKIHHLSSRGNNASAVCTFELCAAATGDLCYVVEDDFFHHADAIARMVDAVRNLQAMGISLVNHVAVYPYDCADRYVRDRPGATRLFHNRGLYWRTITSTTWTLMTTREAWQLAYPMWHYSAQHYSPGGISEDETINQLYNNGVLMEGGPITCYSPIPSLAIHLEYQQPTDILTGFVNWQQSWHDFPSQPVDHK
jgi:hypothetical protein